MKSLKLFALIPALVLAGTVVAPSSALAMCAAAQVYPPPPCNDTPNYMSPVRPPFPQYHHYPQYTQRSFYFYPQYPQYFDDVGYGFSGYPPTQYYGGGYGHSNGWYL